MIRYKSPRVYRKVEDLKPGDTLSVNTFPKKVKSVKIFDDFVRVYFDDGSKREYNRGVSLEMWSRD